jgi:ribose/xylose/arabinose/galactoside ABC-type transport system permease subunit
MALASTRRFEIGDNLFIVVIALKGRYSLFDLRALAVNAMPLALIALGQFVIVLARGIDLSLGPVASVAGAVMALTVTGNPALGFLAPVAIGLGAGLLNGVFVARFGLPAIIVTLATMSIWQGIAVLILPDPGGSVPAGIQQALIGGFSEPLAGLAALVVACLAVTWLLGTRFGMHLRAVGGDEQAARMSGVRVDGVRLAAYAIGGVLAALGGMYLAVATSSGSPTVGDSYILTSIAAIVIGGVPLTGGRGTALGVVMGALILTITGSLLYFAKVSSFYQSVIDGLILLAVVGSGSARQWIRDIVQTRP